MSDLPLETEATMHQTQSVARGTTLCFPGTVTGALQLIMIAIVLADTAQGMIQISFRHLAILPIINESTC